MSDEEKKAQDYFKRRIANKKTAYTSIYFKIEKLETILNLIEKQQKEIKELKQFKKQVEEIESTNFIKYKNYISKDKIKTILGIENEQNDSEEIILSLLKTLVDENNRLENIEDKKVQLEYEKVFNKGVKSVEYKIKAKIKEIEKEEKQKLKGTKGQDRYAIKQEYMYKRSGLQLLLEEKE